MSSFSSRVLLLVVKGGSSREAVNLCQAGFHLWCVSYEHQLLAMAVGQGCQYVWLQPCGQRSLEGPGGMVSSEGKRKE